MVSAQLASAAQSGPLLPLDDPSYDALFDAAKRRAETLLRPPAEDQAIVYAEQIFDQSEILAESKVEGRFNDWNWPALKNRETLVDFMAEVSEWFVRHREKQKENLEVRFHCRPTG